MDRATYEPRMKKLRQALAHKVCIRKHTLNNGCSIEQITRVTSLRPIAPPGKKLMRYQMRASTWIADADKTRTYPWIPPFEKVKNKVKSILPRYIVVKNTRSPENMDFKCSTGPVRIPKLPMKVSEPHVKERANFWGLSAMVGRPTKKARAKKTTETTKSAQKTCIRFFQIAGEVLGACSRRMHFISATDHPPEISAGSPFPKSFAAFVPPWTLSCFPDSSLACLPC